MKALLAESVKLPLLVIPAAPGNRGRDGLSSAPMRVAGMRALETAEIRPVIGQSFPLDGIADAFRYEESGRHFGKICLEW